MVINLFVIKFGFGLWDCGRIVWWKVIIVRYMFVRKLILVK